MTIKSRAYNIAGAFSTTLMICSKEICYSFGKTLSIYSFRSSAGSLVAYLKNTVVQRVPIILGRFFLPWVNV